MPAKKQQLRVGMKRTYLVNGVKVVDQLQATGAVQNGKQVVKWVRISPARRERDIMDLDVGGLESIERQRDVLDMDGGLGI